MKIRRIKPGCCGMIQGQIYEAQWETENIYIRIKLGQDWPIKEGTNKMSSENIKTGLKLSEAIRLIEENEGSLLRVEDDLYEYAFLKSEYWLSRTDRTYSVKLPPPKTVTVTRDDVVKAFYNSYEDHKLENGHILNDWNIEKFLKELGL